MTLIPEWRAWRYPSSAAAGTAFAQILSIAKDLDTADIGVWRSAKPDRSEHYVIIAGESDTIRIVVERFTPRIGVEWDVPRALRDPLWARHIATVAHTYAETGDPNVEVRTQHGERGKFLHRDGTLNPFPEPHGRG